MNTPHESTLGRTTAWPQRYDPSVLFPIPRAQGRAELGTAREMLLYGADIWNAYELSWLDEGGKPRIAIARFTVPAHSTNLIESKSLKLYLGSFASSQLSDEDAVKSRLARDLSRVAGAPVTVELTPPNDFSRLQIESLAGECIDDIDVSITDYGPPNPNHLSSDKDHIVDEVLVSHLLKSNCPVTEQPDWASVQIAYRGPRLDRAGLLRYLVSFREHSGFHEQCVERIFCDLSRHCTPESLSVYARYTRRGGLDINPWRSNLPGTPPNPRLARQ